MKYRAGTDRTAPPARSSEWRWPSSPILAAASGRRGWRRALHLLDHADLGVQLEQQVLKGIQLLVVHQHDGVEPVVPVSNAVEQRNRGQNGHAEREVDPERDIEIARAVDLGRLRQEGGIWDI